MYKKALQDGILFHQFYSWIDQEMSKIYLEKLYHERKFKQSQNLKKCIEIKKEALLAHFIGKFEIKNNYFYENLN